MSAAVKGLLESARVSVPEKTPEGVHADRHSRVLVDVRERHEYDRGHIAGAVHVSPGSIAIHIDKHVRDRDTPLTLYCGVGVGSLLAGKALVDRGHTDVRSMAGGFTAWKKAGLPYESGHHLSESQQERYSRQLIMPEIGLPGQAKLLAARVLLVGAGGLGSPTGLYLTAAGVGTIGIVDADTVDRSNLQRQVVHTEERIGMPKTESARLTLNALNPGVRVVEHQHMLSRRTAADLVNQYDIVVNGCDNFPTRYLINDVAVLGRKPLVDGGVFRFEGQVTTVLPFVSPCYRCRHPVAPGATDETACAEVGVLGVLPGLVGMIQATEVLKLILGVGELLSGRLLHVDALTMRFREFAITRDPGCAVCGEHPTITAV